MSEIESLLLYILVFSSAAIIIQFGYHEKKSGWIVGVGVILPILLASCRYAVGTDYFTYFNAFQRLGKIPLSEYIELNGIEEIGNYFVGYLGNKLDSYNVYLGIVAGLTLIPIYLFLKRDKFDIDMGFSIFIFLCTAFMTSFNIMMQMIAVSISMLSYRYIFKREFLKFLIIILLAASFHSTALLLIPIYFIWNKEDEKQINLFNKRNLLVLLLLCFFVLNIENLFSFLTNIDIFSDYSAYGLKNDGGNNRDIIVKFAYLALVFILRKPLIVYDKRNKLFIIFAFLNFIIGLTGGFSPFIKRMGLYFEVSQIILFPTIVKLSKNPKERRLIRFLFLIYILSLMILTIYVLKQGHLVPYQYKVF